MSGEIKFVLVCVTTSLLCATILFSVLVVILWPYRVLVALCVVILLTGGSTTLCIRLLRRRPQTNTAPAPTVKQPSRYEYDHTYY
jgi:hypothetical protein